jgi:hypothetical protein
MLALVEGTIVMSDTPSDAPERDEASPFAGEDVAVVRYQFGFPHAVVVVLVMIVLTAAWTVPLGPNAPQQSPLPTDGTHARLLDGEAATQADVKRLRELLARPTLAERAAKPEKVIPIDPRVDDAFDALDRSSVKQLKGFLARYRDHDYAKAQGYVAQVEEWHQRARWRAEDERARRQLDSVEWIYD